VGGTSIMGLMMLAAGQGHSIHIEVDGADAKPAIDALVGSRTALAKRTSGAWLSGASCRSPWRAANSPYARGLRRAPRRYG
jgi:hypothetical protein